MTLGAFLSYFYLREQLIQVGEPQWLRVHAEAAQAMGELSHLIVAAVMQVDVLMDRLSTDQFSVRTFFRAILYSTEWWLVILTKQVFVTRLRLVQSFVATEEIDVWM